jgi:uncharacterized protein YdhG (YjbR/CyaY superfamily)
MKMKDYSNIDEYIRTFPKAVQDVLVKMRQLVKDFAPGTEEAIRYGMPTVRLKGKNLLHFAAYSDHIGFYPTPSGINAFKKELRSYVTGKGTISFPVKGPIPWNLVKKVIEFRVKEVTNNNHG